MNHDCSIDRSNQMSVALDAFSTFPPEICGWIASFLRPYEVYLWYRWQRDAQQPPPSVSRKQALSDFFEYIDEETECWNQLFGELVGMGVHKLYPSLSHFFLSVTDSHHMFAMKRFSRPTCSSIRKQRTTRVCRLLADEMDCWRDLFVKDACENWASERET